MRQGLDYYKEHHHLLNAFENYITSRKRTAAANTARLLCRKLLRLVNARRAETGAKLKQTGAKPLSTQAAAAGAGATYAHAHL